MVQYQTTVDRAFAALADPTRRAVLERLGGGSATISELAEPFGMSLTGMKKHIRLLEEANLVATEKVGRARRCVLVPYAFEGISTWLTRLDLAELTLDDAEGGSESVGAAGADVHLLDDGAVAPPFGDQLRVRPNGEDVRARCVEDPLDANLELVRGGDGGGVHRSPFVRWTTCANRSSRVSHVLMPSKA